jgi:hypothetical protein
MVGIYGEQTRDQEWTLWMRVAAKGEKEGHELSRIGECRIHIWGGCMLSSNEKARIKLDIKGRI